MKKILKKILWRTDDDNFYIDKDRKSVFCLMYKNLPIGELVYSGGEWQFAYSSEFKMQDAIKPLVNFPTVDKVYLSDQLWPFFASRIPSNAQLCVASKPRDVVESLKMYGKRTITNPFVLMSR